MGNLDFSANADQLQELLSYIASQINVPTIGIGGGYAPIGTIISYMGTTAPQDYLACDGSTKNIADYPQLADFFEAQFGSKNYFGGDGTTTFAVPDLQGEFLRGTGTNSHADQGSGANVGEHQDATGIPYIFQSDNNIASFTNPSLPSDANNNHFPMNRDSFYEGTGSSTIHRVNQDQTATSMGKAGYYSARPTNTSVLYCIKAVVAGEVYSTEERVVGTWIDGKKLYQKTIDCGTLPNNTTKNVAHGINNIDKVIDANCMVYIPYVSSSIPMPWHSSDNSIIGFICDINTTNIVLKTIGDRTNCTGIATLQYTKTTDG